MIVAISVTINGNATEPTVNPTVKAPTEPTELTVTIPLIIFNKTVDKSVISSENKLYNIIVPISSTTHNTAAPITFAIIPINPNIAKGNAIKADICRLNAEKNIPIAYPIPITDKNKSCVNISIQESIGINPCPAIFTDACALFT